MLQRRPPKCSTCGGIGHNCNGCPTVPKTKGKKRKHKNVAATCTKKSKGADGESTSNGSRKGTRKGAAKVTGKGAGKGAAKGAAKGDGKRAGKRVVQGGGKGKGKHKA
ncbi:hypothetical protein OROGR_018530 [Orobanche gracilis]